jgi:hypothetical protein
MPSDEGARPDDDFRREVKRGGEETGGVKLHPRDLIAPESTQSDDKKLSYFYCRTKSFTLYKVPKENPLCRHLPDLFENGKNKTVTVYAKRMLPLKQKGVICVKKKETVTFYTNFFGDRFTDPKVTKELMTPDDCRDMFRHKVCKEGTMTRLGDTTMYSTHHEINLEFPGRVTSFFKGAQEAQVTNCFLEETEIFVKTEEMTISSPAHDLSHCNYEDESCVVDQMMIVWKKSCINRPGGKCLKCEYSKVKEMEGVLSRRVFVSHVEQMALTFEDMPVRAQACDGTILRIAEQRMGIREEDMRGVALHPKRRPKRSWVTTETLAAELTEFGFNMAATLTKLFQTQCQSGTYVLSNPTRMARKLLGKEEVMANWATSDTLQVYPCARVDAREVKLRRVKEKCYRYIPVEYNLAGVGTLKMFLDPETRILSSTAPEMNCQIRLFVDRPEGLIQYDQKTGEGRRIDPADVHEVPPGVRIGEDDLKVEHFHDHILSNE